jgi:hypothetical protein
MSQIRIRPCDQDEPSKSTGQTLTQAQAFILPIAPNISPLQAADTLTPGQTLKFDLASADCSTTLKDGLCSKTARNVTASPNRQSNRQSFNAGLPSQLTSKQSSSADKAQANCAGRHQSEMSRKGSSRTPNGTSGREKSTVPSAWWRAMNYRCHFCMKVLAPMKMGPLDRLIWFFGFRQMYCQHCFIAHYRPFGLLKLLLAPFRWVYYNLADEE